MRTGGVTGGAAVSNQLATVHMCAGRYHPPTVVGVQGIHRIADTVRLVVGDHNVAPIAAVAAVAVRQIGRHDYRAAFCRHDTGAAGACKIAAGVSGVAMERSGNAGLAGHRIG